MNNLVDKKELIKLSEDIQQSIDVVNHHKEKLDKYTAPKIKTNIFNVVGIVTDTAVNKALNDLTRFICDNFSLSSTIHNFHNEHFQKICELLGLISLAEVELYKKQKKLSENDVEAINKIKSLYEKYKKIDDSDNSNKQRITKLVEFTHALSEFRTEKFNSLKQNVDSNSKQIFELKRQLESIEAKIDDNYDKMQDKFDKVDLAIEKNKELILAREKYIEDNNAQQFKQCKEENEKLKNQINVFKQDFSKLQKLLIWSFVISGIATIIAAFSFAF